MILQLVSTHPSHILPYLLQVTEPVLISIAHPSYRPKCHLPRTTVTLVSPSLNIHYPHLLFSLTVSVKQTTTPEGTAVVAEALGCDVAFARCVDTHI